MPKKVLVLFAVTGLLVFAFAGQSAGSAIPAKNPARHHPDRDSIRMLHARHRGASLPAGIDANKVIQQVHSRQGPGSPRPLSDGPAATTTTSSAALGSKRTALFSTRPAS